MRTRVIVDLYLEDARDRRLAPKTIDGYEWGLAKLARAFPDTLPDDPDGLVRFIGRQGLCDSSQHDLWRLTKTFWRWASKRGLAADIMELVPAPQTRRKLPRTLTDEEMERLLEAPKSKRDLALLAVLLDTGIRLGEAASLRHSSILPQGLVVTGKTGDRIVPVSAHVRDLLLEIRRGRDIWIGRQGPMKPSGVSLAVRRLLRKANIKPPKAGPHTLRHTFALRFIMVGGDVFSLQRIMGHRSVETTMIYAYMSDNLVAAQHSRYSPMASYQF